jgi:hypothetical protein
VVVVVQRNTVIQVQVKDRTVVLAEAALKLQEQVTLAVTVLQKETMVQLVATHHLVVVVVLAKRVKVQMAETVHLLLLTEQRLLAQAAVVLQVPIIKQVIQAVRVVVGQVRIMLTEIQVPLIQVAVAVALVQVAAFILLVVVVQAL